jgi:hypothetical protein
MGHIGEIGPHRFEKLFPGTVCAFFDFIKIGLDGGEERHGLGFKYKCKAN